MDSALAVCQAGHKLNTTKSIRWSLPDFSSALWRYFNFCEVSASPSYPVSERAIPIWGAIINDGRTFGNYTNFDREAFFLLNDPTSWNTSASINTANGLRSAGKGRFRFPNFIRSDLVAKLTAFDPFGSQLAQLEFGAYLFALRAPSGALQIRRAFSSDSLYLPQPANSRALISVRLNHRARRLHALSLSRKSPTGCAQYRPCFCGLSPASPNLRALCPVRVWRMRI